MPRVVVGSGFVAQYPQGGGVFAVVLQYLLGLRRLGCQVCWLELLWSQGPHDHALIRTFGTRLVAFGLERDFCLVYFPCGRWPELGEVRERYGWSRDQFRHFCAGADLLLDLCASVRPPDLVGAVRRATLLDLDPSFMQLWMTQWDMGQERVRDAHSVAGDFASYRRYIHRSCGECSVAKPGYVKSRSGWLSDRSACYVAAGRPVLVQETGFSRYLPTGRGVLHLTTLEEAVVGAVEIKRHYARHCQAARELAHEYFSAEKVLAAILREAGV